MVDLVIYDEKKNQLTEVGFVKDTLDQTKIREIDNSYELSKQLGILFSTISNLAGIKGAIEDFQKTDIKEMILMRFKTLSLNEIAYAFKLERYGLYDDKTDHFQLFDADYVSKILDKYVRWKRNVKIKHNISAQKSKENIQTEISESEKKALINQGVINQLEYYLENESVDSGRLYVYDVLYEMDYLPKDKEYKIKKYESAKEVLRLEADILKPTNREDLSYKKKLLNEIQKDKSGKVVSKAKELVLMEFFRKLVNNDKIQSFRKDFQ